MAKHAYFLDLLVVLVFAAAGRASHDQSGDVLGVLSTAWPFLVGMAIGWIAMSRRRPGGPAWWLEGTVVWACTLLIGMLIRLVTDAGTALPFVLVATGTLLLGFLGWRAVAALALVYGTRAHPS